MAIDELGRTISSGTIVDGRKVVTTATTELAIASTSTVVAWIIITAELDNTDIICVGASTVVEADNTRRGIPLVAGDSVTLRGVDLAKVYLDSAQDGEGVTYLYSA